VRKIKVLAKLRKLGTPDPCVALQATITDLETKLAAAEGTLNDPNLLHLAMLRGTVPKLSWRQVCHLSGEVYNGEEAQLSEIVRLREVLEAAEAKVARVEALPDLIPTNWLDPLLTGPDSPLPPGFEFTAMHIEKLLRGIKERIKDAVKAALREDGK